MSTAGEMSFTSLVNTASSGNPAAPSSRHRSHNSLAALGDATGSGGAAGGAPAAPAFGQSSSARYYAPVSGPYGITNASCAADPASHPPQQPAMAASASGDSLSQYLKPLASQPLPHQHDHQHPDQHPNQQQHQQQQVQPLRPAAGSQASLAQSQSHGSLLMAGPGSLCASLPRYVRHPPIEAVVFGWGVSEDGQLGLAECGGDVGTPKVVEALLGVHFSGRSFCRTPLVAGSRNTLALDATGQVWSFGWNDRGTLGLGHSSVERKPQRIAALKGIRVVQVAIGGWHCLALSDKGTMFAWGGNEYGQCGSVVPGQRDIVEPLPVDLGLGPTQRVRQVSAGGMHSLALLEDGTVWQWGENWGDFSLHPVRTPRPVPGAVAVAAVSCGAFHNLMLTAGGRVLSWGMNDYGQLGNGSTTYATAPRPVLDMDGIVVADIAAGGWHSCALSSAGEVWVWGRGEYGRLGLGDRSGSSKLRPQKVRGLESHVVVQVAAGGSHTVALTADARLFVWGRGAFGRLGLGDGNRDCYHPVEVTLPGGPERWKVAAIGAGGRHSICLAIPVRDPACLPIDQASDLYDLYGTAILGGGLLRHDAARSSEEYDVDGFSEPSLYDKDLVFEQLVLPDAPSPLRPRRVTAGASVTADGSIAAAVDAAGRSSGGVGAFDAAADAAAVPLPGGAATGLAGATGGGGGGGGSGWAPASVVAESLPVPPMPDLRPPPPLSDWPSIDSAGGVPPIAVDVSVTDSGGFPAVLSPVTLEQPLPQSQPPPSRAHPSGSAASVHSSSNGGAPPSPPRSVMSGASVAPPPPLPPLRPPSGTTASLAAAAAATAAPALPGSGTGSASETPNALDSPSRSPPLQPLSPLPPPPPVPPSYGMRRTGSAVGSLSSLSQILPGPAAAAAAAVLDADSDLAPPRGLAAAAAAAVAAVVASGAMSIGASRPSSAQGSAQGNNANSRGGSVTGMQRFRTVFGGGGEEEDEAMQAAEAAEAAAEDEDRSGAGEDELGPDLDDAQDDTDEDQGLYEGSGVQHPRSPSLLSRPRSPPMPLSPRRHPSLNAMAAAAAVGIGSSLAGPGSSSGSSSLQRNPSMAAAAAPPAGPTAATAMAIGGGGAHHNGGQSGAGGSGPTASSDRSQPPSGSPSSRSLLAASYGSPRVPSSIVQPQQQL